MEQANYVQVVPDSQFYTDLEMIKRNIENLKARVYCPDADTYTIDGGVYCYTTSLEEEIDYLIKGIENTALRYKLTKNDDKE